MTQWQPDRDPWQASQQSPQTPPQRGRQPQYPPPGPQYPPRQQPPYRQPPQYQPPGYGPQYPPPGPPRRHKKSRGYGSWIAAGVVIGVVAAGAAVYVLHGSSGPLTCAQQYASWKTGTGAPEAAGIGSDSSALTAAGKTEDIKAMDTALVKLGTDADADKSHPMPACADPAGYWPQILSAMQAAGDNASVTPGLGGLLTAEAPLKPVTGLEKQLKAELTRTTAAPTS